MSETSLDKDLPYVREWLTQKMRCPLCSFPYDLDGIKLLPRSQKTSRDVLVHTDCAKCECPLLFALDVRDGEVFLVGIVTDLTYADALKFQDLKPFGADEILDFHLWLNSFDGNFEKAFGY
jgi:hypothetical protein